LLLVKSIASIKFEDSRPASLRAETTWNISHISTMLIQIEPCKISSADLIQWAEMISYICGLLLFLTPTVFWASSISRGLIIASIRIIPIIRRWFMIATILQTPSIIRGMLVKIIFRFIHWLCISHNYRPTCTNIQISK